MSYFFLYTAGVVFVISVIGIFAYYSVRYALQDGGDLVRQSLRAITGGLNIMAGSGLTSRGSTSLRHLQVQDPGQDGSIKAGTRIALRAPITTLGRSHDNHIVLADEKVSGHHASFSLERGTWQLSDRDSSNGTYLFPSEGMARQVKDKPEALAEGDVIEIGSVRLRLVA